MGFEWYSEVTPTTPLEQGDILEKCSVILPTNEHYNAIVNNIPTEAEMDIIEIIAIVLSQSCDIVNDKIDSIIVCPIWPLKHLIEIDSHYKSSQAREDLRRGNSLAYHLLNKIKLCNYSEDFYFVDFRNIYSLPKKFILGLLKRGNRKRLLPPYREHLAQNFARYFMRVGLPINIPPEDIKNYK